MSIGCPLLAMGRRVGEGRNRAATSWLHSQRRSSALGITLVSAAASAPKGVQNAIDVRMVSPMRRKAALQSETNGDLGRAFAVPPSCDGLRGARRWRVWNPQTWHSVSGGSVFHGASVCAQSPLFVLGCGAAALLQVTRHARSHAKTSQASGKRFQATATVEGSVASLVTENVRVPDSDQRKYRVLRLANGMQVFLASDPTADAAAAALTVQAGTFQDPDDRPGLAHFHEHMLFLGTEKYPAEDEYNKYLGEHGGNSNAFTMGEYTSYYFKVTAAHLDGALDRFSQFFVAPTFDPSCVEREMKAVDSENTNYSTEDGWRFLQVTKVTVADSHPFSRFDVGDLTTLGSEEPLRTREELLRWNAEHYRAGAMTLAVLGRSSLEELEEQVLQRFEAVPAGEVPKPSYGSLPWPEAKRGRLLRCLPLKESRAISVCFALPPPQKYLFAKPESYISHVLGHEGEGSLHEALSQRGWVDSLSAGPAHVFLDAQLLAVNISLTPEGDSNWEGVLALLFKFIELVKQAGPQETIFRELAALQEISFAHKEESPLPDDFVTSVALSLHKYPPEEAIRGPFALDEWRPEVVADYLGMLDPAKSLIFHTSSSFGEEAGSTDELGPGWRPEKWYGALYAEEVVDDALLARWMDSLDEAANSSLRLPKANRFVPQDFSLREPSSASEKGGSKLPTEVMAPGFLYEDSMLRLWHKLDEAFKTPREYVLTYIHTPAYAAGPEAVTMMRLFCRVITDDLNAFSYDASVAGLSYGVSYTDNLTLSVGGFNDKLPDLMHVVLQRMETVLRDCEDQETPTARREELLEKLKTSQVLFLQDYRNLTKEEPWSICGYWASQIMLPGSWNVWEYIQVLEGDVSLQSMAKAVRSSLARVSLDMLVHGNASASEAKSLGKELKEQLQSLGAAPLPSEDLRRWRVTKLPEGSEIIFEFDLVDENPSQENSCTQNIYQVGMTGQDQLRDACLSVVCHIAGTSAFQRLRTEEQLGYIVYGGAWAEQLVAGLSVTVQGNRLHPEDVNTRIEAWLLAFQEELEKMPQEEFNRNVQAVVSELTQRYALLGQETTRHWAEIMPRHYRFDRVRQSVETLERLSQEDVLGFFKKHLAPGAPARRKLSLRVLGSSAREAPMAATMDAPQGGTGTPRLTSAEDIRSFHRGCETFPAGAPNSEPLPTPLCSSLAE